MKYRDCRGLEKQWSAVTLGCWQLAPSGGWGDICSAREADATVKCALDCGITAFDTAEGYGDGESERRLGQALGSRKDDVIVISKIWPDAELSLSAYRERLEGSLCALGRDWVDVYLIHWPGEGINSKAGGAALVEIMSALQASGKATVVGLSNFHRDDLLWLGDGASKFVVNEVPYSMLRRRYEGETREICKRAGLPYMAYSPTAVGLLAGRTSREARHFPARLNNRLFQEPLFSGALKVAEEVAAVARECGSNSAAVAVAWALAQDNVLTAIVGSRKASQVEEFAEAGDLLLGSEHIARLQQKSDGFSANS